jgi:phospholipase C
MPRAVRRFTATAFDTAGCMLYNKPTMTRLSTICIGCLFTTSLLLGQASNETATPIKHLVVIFQENVSFDHYFATYPVAANPPGDPGFFERTDSLFPTPGINGLSGGLMTNNRNAESPFRLSRSQAVTCSQSHDYTREQKAFNSGLMDKFVEFTSVSTATCDQGLGRKLVMGYYDGNTVTAMWNYAQNFAMSDNYFASTFGPSTPGALNLIAGQTHGATVVRDTGNASSQIVAGSMIADVRSAYDDCVPATQNTVSMSGKNVGDLLNARGITWGWFQGGFRPSSRTANGTAVCATAHANIAGAMITDYVPHHEPFQYWASTANPHHLSPTSFEMIGKTDQANHQYDMDDFWGAAYHGTLPAVSFLKAPAYEDGHSSNSDPLDEQRFVVTTINALQDLPDWESTAVIITYDDSDGWYDHVMPPIVSASNTSADAVTGAGACGTAVEGAQQGRCGYGPRLPLLVISNWARVNYVDHTLTDQSSVLRFIEDNWNLGRIGDQSFDERAGSIMKMFDFRNKYIHAERLYLDPATGTP